MQALASIFNQPVTAFIEPGDTGTEIRYFTPVTEIDACGHATLAAGAVLLNQKPDPVTFITATGRELLVTQRNGMVQMKYSKFDMEKAEPSPSLLRSLHLEKYFKAGYCSALDTLFIELEDPGLLIYLDPDFSLMMQAEPHLKEVVIHCPAQQADYALRSFCPWIGINEDPVTGSVHSVLAPYWSDRLEKKELKAYQASSRGGHVYLEDHPDHVIIGGYCNQMVVPPLPLSKKTISAY